MSSGAASGWPTAPPVDALAAVPGRAWLVGGAVRDRLLGRATTDFDVVVDGDARSAAQELARRADAHRFELSHAFGAWRVIARDRSWHVDLVRLGGETIEADLALRDLTVNAMGRALPDGPLVDPFGGAGDLRARRLRAVGDGSFARDPLRVLRLARLACELGFTVEPATATAAREVAPRLEEVAPERVFEELKRIVCSECPVAGFELMDRLAATESVLPELTALRGVEQSRFHHLDVREHTLAVLAEAVALERDPSAALGPHAQAVDEFLRRPLANDLSRWQALRLGALLHDVAKPQTRSVTQEGRVTFMSHDRRGADVARAVLTRLRGAERLREHVALLVRHHLRLGFLVHQMPITRAAVYEYLEACEPVGVDVTALSVADRLATRGEHSEEAIAKHLELAGQMLGESLQWAEKPPQAPVRGDDLVRELGLTPGPEVGRILSELRRAAFANEIGSRAQAIDRARALLRASDG